MAASLVAVNAHPAVTGYITRRSCCTARPWYSRRVSSVRESMQKTGGCRFLPHHEPRLGGIRSAAASTGNHTVHVIDRICASEKTTVDTLWMTGARWNEQSAPDACGSPSRADLEWQTEHIHNCQTAPHGARHAHARVYARTYSNTPHHTDTD